jgi:hypothetical protein
MLGSNNWIIQSPLFSKVVQSGIPQCNSNIPRKKDDKYTWTCERYWYQRRFHLHITKCKIGCTTLLYGTSNILMWEILGDDYVSEEYGNEVVTNVNGV